MRAMGPMLHELYRHPEKVFLGGEFFLCWWGRRWHITGARSRTWSDLPATQAACTYRLGSASTEQSARMAQSGSCTKSIWPNLAITRQSTRIRLPSDHQRPPSASARSALGRRRGGVWCAARRARSFIPRIEWVWHMFQPVIYCRGIKQPSG